MEESTFYERLAEMFAQGRFLCIGLDPNPQLLPRSIDRPTDWQRVVAFNRAIIDATHYVTAAYKPNLAFYLSLGEQGWLVLERTIEHIRRFEPPVLIILDGKFGDIGSSNSAYATAAFDLLKVDAVTVNPYAGGEALVPFLRRQDKGVFILCKTSNPGAADLQDDPIGGQPLYQTVARKTASVWNKFENCGLVVGATYPKELAAVRRIVGPEVPILIPGIGKQGGDLEEAIRAGRGEKGGILINASRSILYASSGADFAQAANDEALRLANEIRKEIKAKKER